jgi:hypothetical protein
MERLNGKAIEPNPKLSRPSLRSPKADWSVLARSARSLAIFAQARSVSTSSVSSPPSLCALRRPP